MSSETWNARWHVLKGASERPVRLRPEMPWHEPFHAVPIGVSEMAWNSAHNGQAEPIRCLFEKFSDIARHLGPCIRQMESRF